MALAFAGDSPVIGQDDSQTAREYRLKAEYLCNLARYVTWPAEAPQSNFVIGVLGESLISEPLAALAAERKVGNRQIVVHQFVPPAKYKACHILFLSNRLTPEKQRQVIQIFGKQPLLLVGETAGFAANGGMINFVSQERHVRFEINRHACQKARLELDAKFLSLGQAVVPSPQH